MAVKTRRQCVSHALWAAPRGGNETHLVRNAHNVDNERRWSARTLRKCGDVNEHSLHLLIAHNRTVLQPESGAHTVCDTESQLKFLHTYTHELTHRVIHPHFEIALRRQKVYKRRDLLQRDLSNGSSFPQISEREELKTSLSQKEFTPLNIQSTGSTLCYSLVSILSDHHR